MCLYQQRPQLVAGVNMAWLPGQYLAVARLGLGQLTVAMVQR